MSNVDSWQIKEIGSVVTLQRGFDLPSRLRKAGPYPIISSSGPYDVHAHAMVKGPGVVTGRYGTIGLTFLVKEDFWPLNTTLFVSDFHGNDERFCFYLLKTIDFDSHSGKSGVPGINRNDIHSLKIKCPSRRPEQEAIAKALADVDTLITALETLIAKKRDIKQSAMQELLSGQRRLQGFKEEWSATSLKAVSAFITKGSTPTTYGFGWVSSGILFLRSECVSGNGLDLDQSMMISEDAHRALARSEIRAGDILITITGNVGRVVYLDSNIPAANINQHIARIRITSSKADARFVYHYLKQARCVEYFNSITTGQAYPQLSLRQVREMSISLPCKAEQLAIAMVLSEMDAEITSLEAKLAKACDLKKGMMQVLLTGEVRLL